MELTPELILVGAVGAVGVLHTIVPDHWLPIALLARDRGWSRAQTARAALQAGTGHVLSTLAIGLVVWLGGVAFATRFGTALSSLSSLALIAFGAWIAISAFRELNAGGGHRHGHDHGHDHDHDHDHDHHDEHHRAGRARGPAATGAAGGTSSRTALLLILGSSPMLEGIPAFFAAGRYGLRLIAVMAAVFAAATIATYVVVCVTSAAGLQQLRIPAVERYGEVLSGTLIVVVGSVFLLWPHV
jgi:ABC-type nickel/cobalt efflux system permease component RcnA